MSQTLPGVIAGSPAAPAPRTLVDVLRATALEHPDASALEDERGAWSYAELVVRVGAASRALADAGVRRGDRVGVRMPSGDSSLYLTILAVLAAGAAYVPVDADDPDERAALVFGEAGVVGIVSAGGRFTPRDADRPDSLVLAAPAGHVSGRGTALADDDRSPTPDDDAWVIFTSGSTGT